MELGREERIFCCSHNVFGVLLEAFGILASDARLPKGVQRLESFNLNPLFKLLNTESIILSDNCIAYGGLVRLAITLNLYDANM